MGEVVLEQPDSEYKVSYSSLFFTEWLESQALLILVKFHFAEQS